MDWEEQNLGQRPEGEKSTLRKPERRIPPQISTDYPRPMEASHPGGNVRKREGKYPPDLAVDAQYARSPTVPRAEWETTRQGAPSPTMPQYPATTRSYPSSPMSQTFPMSQVPPPAEFGQSPQRGNPVTLPTRRDYQRLEGNDSAASGYPSPAAKQHPITQTTTKYPSSLTLQASQVSLQKSEYPPSLPSNASPSRPQGNMAPICYDYQLKPTRHASAGLPRYICPTTGKCRKLKVQSTNPGPGENSVSGGARTLIRLGVWLVHHVPRSVQEVPMYFLKWLWFIVCIPWTMLTSLGYSYTGLYKRYFSKYFGQLWIARSIKEYSMRYAHLHGSPMPVGPGHPGDTQTVTHAPYPRQLMIHDKTGWSPCTNPDVLKNINYMAVSYTWDDFPNKVAFRDTVRHACLEQALGAYWLDFECVGGSDVEKTLRGEKYQPPRNEKEEEEEKRKQAEKNEDLYRIADVYRGATKTLILIGKYHSTPPGKQSDSHPNPWVRWGERMWTLPEALLSRDLLYKAGDDPVYPITLRQVGNMAYAAYPEEMAIIDGFSGKDALGRLERLVMLKKALWRRWSTAHPRNPPPGPPKDHGKFTAYPAERVYALMGFFEHRITPDPQEDYLTALARLSMVNDSDRLVERMIAMLPSHIMPQACWYSDNDLFEANLWDVEPKVQVAGITKTGALVLDGCRAAPIRWKDFPRMAYMLKPSWRRLWAFILVFVFFFVFFAGLMMIRSITGVVTMVFGLLLLCFGPKLVEYATSGRVIMAQPWLIGVKGFISAKDVSARMYGGSSRGNDMPMVAYSTSGSIFARPETGMFRRGDTTLSEKAVYEVPQGDMYTLVDTQSNTVYHFTARKPPTVCVFVGREGGLGRFLLCSESCDLNELHKESVVRLPSYVCKAMGKTDWLAIGGTSDMAHASCE